MQWGRLDYLIIDSPPGTGDKRLTVAQTIPDAKAIIVTTPQEISLADVRKAIDFCRTVEMTIFGVVENMSGFVCPHCGQHTDLFGTGGGQRMALRMNIPFLAQVPFDPRMVRCGDIGEPCIAKYPNSEATRAFNKMVGRILEVE